MSIRLMIVDDHEVIRLGVRALLSGSGIDVIAEAEAGEEASALIGKKNPQIVLLDIRMPGGDGLTTLSRIKLDHPDLPVLIFSAYDNPTYIARAVALGASGFVLKSTEKEKLIKTIKLASTGDLSWTREELRRVTGALATPRLNVDVDVPLTQRESEVLRQLALGLTNKEIAHALAISYETVKEHVQHILKKIGVSDRTQAAVWAVRSGLV